MASSETGDSSAEQCAAQPLQYCLARAIDPYSCSELDREQHRQHFVELVKEQAGGAASACRLIAHKAQSPDENEAMNALLLLEQCTLHGGQAFSNEVGKFKFLNELIKLLSPKYLGSVTAGPVKTKVIELLYTWKHTMPSQAKVREVYDVLRAQKIIATDPNLQIVQEQVQNARAQRDNRMASFEDEEKSRLLTELLASNDPQHLQAANRLIKSLVRAEDERVEAKCRRSHDLQCAMNNSRLLSDMASQFDSTSSAADVNLMRELYNTLVQLRRTLIHYAGEAGTVDDATLADILSTNDDVNAAIDAYKQRVEPHLAKYALNEQRQTRPTTSQLLLDVDSPSSAAANKTTLEALADLSLGSPQVETTSAPVNVVDVSPPSLQRNEVGKMSSEKSNGGTKTTPQNSNKMNALDELSQSILATEIPDGVTEQMRRARQKTPMSKLTATSNERLLDVSEGATKANAPPALEDIELSSSRSDCFTDFLLFEGDRPPVLLCDMHNVRCVLLHTQNNQGNRHVLLANITSTNKQPLSRLHCEIATNTPKVNVMCEALSTTTLPAFRPIGAQQSANALICVDGTADIVTLSYKLSFQLADDMPMSTAGVTNVQL